MSSSERDGGAPVHPLRLLRMVLSLLEPRHRLRAAGLVALMVLGSALEVLGIGAVLPFLAMAQRPDRIFEQPGVAPALRTLGVTDPGTALVLAGVALVVLFLLKNVFLSLQWHAVYGFFFARTGDVSSRLLRTYVHAPWVEHAGRDVGELIRNTTAEVQRVFLGVLLPFLRLLSELLVATGLAVLLALEGGAAFGALVFVGLVGWGVAAAVRGRLGRLARSRMEQEGERIGWVNRSLGGLKEIKVLGREAYFLEGFDRATDRVYEALRFRSLMNVLPRMAVESVAVIALVSFVVALLLSGRAPEETFGLVALLGVATVRLIPSAGRILNAINNLRFNAPSAETVFGELSSGPVPEPAASDASRRSRPPPAAVRAERPGGSDPGGPEAGSRPELPFRRAIELDGVSFGYPDATAPAVDGVSLTIEKGTTVALAGPSGAGKTTVVDMVLGLLEPAAGRVLVDGTDLYRHRAAWRRRIGYIPQSEYLADDTIRRNVAFGVPDAEIDPEAVWAALESASLARFVRNLDHGLDTRVGERGGRLSGGQRQRLVIARALYHDPPVLVLDEATSSLDSRTERRVADAVAALPEDKTVLIVAHRLTTIRDCDVIHVLEQGRLRASGTYDDLVAGDELFRSIARAAGPTATPVRVETA